MADDRSGPGSRSPADEVHDDDELADVLAAELERYATGAVPVVGRGGVPEPVRPVLPPIVSPLDPLRWSGDRPSGRRASAPGAAAPARSDSAAFPRPRERARSRDEPRGGSDVPAAGPEVSRPAVDLGVGGESDAPIRRRSGFRPPAVDPGAPSLAPIERVLRTAPVSLPEATATLLEEMVADSGDARAATRPARHASAAEPARTAPTRLLPGSEAPPPSPPDPAASSSSQGHRRLDGTGPVRVESPDPVGDDLPEQLRATGPMPVPRPLYSDWEQSLRSIGRPRAPWDDDSPLQGGAAVDATTIAMPVQPTGPVGTPRDRPVEPARLAPLAVAEPDPEPPTGRVRRSGRRRAAPPPDPGSSAPLRTSPTPAPLPAPLPAPMPIESDAAGDEEGIDEVVAPHPRVSAATTGAIDLPLSDPRPRTGPVLVERVRTAILQLPVVPDSPTGSGAAALAGRWAGAFASPVVLLLAFGVAAAGAGPAAAVLAIVGLLAALPAVLRSAAWAARAQPGDREERALLGTTGGTVGAVLLLAARVAAAALVTFAASTTASAWVARTGALGGSASTAAMLAACAVGVVSLLVAVLPLRATAVIVQVLGAVGVIGTVLLVLLLVPTTAPVDPAAAGGPAAVTAGAAVGLVLLLCGADLVRWRTDLASPVRAMAGVLLGAATGVAVLVAGVLVAGGVRGDPADGLAAALSDGSAADLAGPLAVVLIATAPVLPILLLRSSGAGAARLLLGGGERLGAAAAGLLALAGCLGLLAIGAEPAPVALAVAALAGVPVAAWAGVRTLGAADGRTRVAAVGAGLGVLVAWTVTDGLLPGLSSPVLDAVGLSAATGLRGGPLLGFGVAFAVGAAAGALARVLPVPAPLQRDPADTVEG